jgi:hypothetical protein
MSTLNTNKAAPASIVLPHYAFAAISFLFLTVLMFLSAESFIGHYFNPKLLAITHIATLGWGSMLIFGALYQFLPVILISDLYSPFLAKCSFVFFVIGISILVYSFWTFSVGPPIQMGAGILFIAATLFTYNIIATFKQAKEANLQADFIAASCIWFWLTVLIGMLMAFNFTHPFLPKEHLYYLKIHAHIGIVGWFLLLIIGVSSRLVPMFLLSSSVNNSRLKYSYYIINGALIGFLIDSFLFNGVSRGLIYFILVIIGLGFYLSFLFLVYKKRARKILDFGMKQSMIAFVVIGIPVIMGLLINSGLISDTGLLLQMILVYGVSIFLGFISLLILGKTFKTLPFIVWLKLNKSKGLHKIPLPKDLYSEVLVKWQFVFFILGLIILLVGILISNIVLIKAACGLLVIAAIFYNINVFKLLLYKNKIN